MKKHYLLWLLIVPLFLSACGSTTTTPTTTTTTTTTLAGTSLRKGPYLVYPNETSSMIVMWQTTSTPTVNKIEWGTSTAYDNLATTTESGALADEHLSGYQISALTPATRYYYKVTVDRQVETGSFTTAADSSAKNLSFYAVSDHHGTVYQNIIHAAMLLDLDRDPARQTFCLNAGDLNDDSEDEYKWDSHFFDPGYNYTGAFLKDVPVMSALGNHDTYYTDWSTPTYPGDLVRKYWPFSYYATADRSYYSFNYGPAHVVVLDQYADHYAYTLEASAQYLWLQADLAANTRPWTIVMFHQPAWTASLDSGSGSHGNNTDIQDHLCPLFKTYDVDVVIQGHEHYYAHVEPPDGIVYLTLGGGGGVFGTPKTTASYLLASAKTYHFARFNIVDQTMEVTVLNDSNGIVDRFTVTN
jgi:hypothetical protein